MFVLYTDNSKKKAKKKLFDQLFSRTCSDHVKATSATPYFIISLRTHKKYRINYRASPLFRLILIFNDKNRVGIFKI